MKVTAGGELQEGVCVDQVHLEDMGSSRVQDALEPSVTSVLGMQE